MLLAPSSFFIRPDDDNLENLRSSCETRVHGEGGIEIEMRPEFSLHAENFKN